MMSTLFVSPLYVSIKPLNILIITVFITKVLATGGNNYTYKQMVIIHELPTDHDLEKYMRVLEKALFFVDLHKYYVDMHLSFGIFLTNVNLRAMMKYRITDALRTRLGYLLLSSTDILEYFYKTVLNHSREHRKVLLPILSLYMNETSWQSKLQKFNKDLLNITKHYFRKDLEDRYSKWSKYIENISASRTDPNPKDEDDCFNLLAQNPVNNKTEKVICHIPFSCSHFIRSGSDRGYDMKNRIQSLMRSQSLKSEEATLSSTDVCEVRFESWSDIFSLWSLSETQNVTKIRDGMERTFGKIGEDISGYLEDWLILGFVSLTFAYIPNLPLVPQLFCLCAQTILACLLQFFCISISTAFVRLLMVIAAEFSRNCAIAIAKENKEFIDEFCAMIFNEAEYIANHEFREASLIMEQIALCSLAGHAQFLRESWIDELIDFQTAVGCFNVARPENDNTLMKGWGEELEDWQYMKTKPAIWAGTCYTHITGSGAAMFAGVIRYIIETYHSS